MICRQPLLSAPLWKEGRGKRSSGWSSGWRMPASTPAKVPWLALPNKSCDDIQQKDVSFNLNFSWFGLVVVGNSA